MNIAGIRMVFLQYGFSCETSDHYCGQTLSDIAGICMVFSPIRVLRWELRELLWRNNLWHSRHLYRFLQYGFWYETSDHYCGQTLSDIARICMVYHHYGFSCVNLIGNCGQTISNIADICKAFRQYEFSGDVWENCREQMISHIAGGICVVFLHQHGFSHANSDEIH